MALIDRMKEFAERVFKTRTRSIEEDSRGKTKVIGHTLDASEVTAVDYAIVHLCLHPKGEPEGRTKLLTLRARIDHKLAALGAIKLHDDAYVVPVRDQDSGGTARDVWSEIVAAGASAQPALHEAWTDGDAVYVHYSDDYGMHCLGAIAVEGKRLPTPEPVVRSPGGAAV